MESKTAIYVKCRPRDADTTALLRKHRRIFLGYPPFIEGVDPALPIEQRMHSLGLASHIPSERLSEDCRGRGYRSSITLQQNIVRQVGIGSIAVVPQLGSGVCWLAKIASPFTLFAPGEIGEEYLQLRREQGLPVEEPEWHLADMVQGWSTTEWVEVPFVWIPRWIGQRALQRNTVGIIKDRDGHHRAYDVLERLFAAPSGIATYEPTEDSDEIARRLVDLLSPASFEHLVVDVLRLERPDLMWLHVGGTGDGGADGIGFRANGTPAAILQCKLRWPGWLDDPRAEAAVRRPELIIASLDPVDARAPADAEIWGPERIATAVVRHAGRLPVARPLGISGAW
jgi:hypothetical protein